MRSISEKHPHTWMVIGSSRLQSGKDAKLFIQDMDLYVTLHAVAIGSLRLIEVVVE